MIAHTNPFETYLTQVPTDGRGLNPLLQNPYMVIHPPSLYVGFIGMTIPFAFGLAALITGLLDDSWLRAVRRWTMVAWLFLTFGLTLGGLWAYEELGWGGFWGWDPVENAGLLPWFPATAFLHSVMVQERRGMLRVWNVALVIVTFFLTIFATFMTRSGIVQSVHAFGEDRELAWMFTVFMVLVLTVSFGYLIYRLPLLRSRHELDSWSSREAAFLVNNWILLFSAFLILFATMFPTLSEAVTGERLTVGPPFFNKWMTPIGLMLLFLTGVGPLLAWRKSTPANLRYQFLWPTTAGVVIGAAVVTIGIPFWASGLCFALCAFVTGTIVQEFVRGANVRKGATGTDFLTALIGLVGRSRRRYGGYIIHAGIVLMFLGFAGSGYKLEEMKLLKPGQQMQVGRYTVRYNGISVTDDGQKQMITGHVTAVRDGEVVGEMRPAKWVYRKHEDQPTTEVAIRRSLADDLYVHMAGFEMANQSATIQVFVNPLVNWVWIGFSILALGTVIALLPESSFAFAAAKIPEGAATTTMLLLAIALTGTPLAAQQPHVEGESDPAMHVPATPLEKQMQRELVCICGTCGHKNLAECTCGYAARMRDQLASRIRLGENRDQIREYFIAQYGSQEPLGAPIDKGFNRLAWLFPYLVGAASAIAIGIVAVRWSRQTAALEPGTAPSAIDPKLEARLEDELRDLD
jgi:cytochrome c-type biogenesis protein CcmF